MSVERLGGGRAVNLGQLGAAEELQGELEAKVKEQVAERVAADPARALQMRMHQQQQEMQLRQMFGIAAPTAGHPSLAEAPREAAEARDALEELGYDTGTTGASLSEALRKFQHEMGLPETGGLDAETLMALVESMMQKQRGASGGGGASAPQRKNSSWASGRPGGAPGVQNGPVSKNGYAAPKGDFSKAPAATGDNSKVSSGPAPKGKVDLSTEEGKKVFREAAKLAGVPESWADSPAMRALVNHESGGVVGRLNYTYGKRDMDSVHAELKNGKISAKSSATGLGQLLLSNVDKYYPKGRAGIGDPVQEAAGMMAYIKDRYGSPDVAWGNHSANPRRHQGVPVIYRAEGY